MATSANSYTTPTPAPRPTGDLEYLFRQRLGEAEVPPRALLWEQLDHDLLVQQNDAYRRRLVMYRWLAAACVLLVLGVGSWAGLRALHQPLAPGAAGLAARSGAPQNADQRVASASATPDQRYAPAKNTANPGAIAGDLLISTGAYRPTPSVPANSPAALLGQPEMGGVGAAAHRPLFNSQVAVVAAGYAAPGAAANGLATPLDGLTMRAVRLVGGRGYHRPDTLKPALLAAPPMLAALAGPTPRHEPSATPAKRWRLSGSHAVTAFNPNINFSQAGSGSFASPNGFAADSRSSAYEIGAAEYRHQLRAGVGQRASLAASLAPSKHWVLTAGVEVAEYRASSETSFALAEPTAAAFTGKTTAAAARSSGSTANFALVQPAAYYAQPRTTNYRYQTVGVPVSVRYGSAKKGVSLYAKVGAAVDLLLGSRVEVAEAAAATREYSLRSQDSPYRKVVAMVRGGGGVQYRPADANWALLVGPTAEAGLTTLNRDPAQSLLNRARPYAVGLEASVEFGGGSTATSPVKR